VGARRAWLAGAILAYTWAPPLVHFLRSPKIAEGEPDVSANESYELRPSIPIIRVFWARAKPGHEKALADKLATSSIEVVQGRPGFLGYLAAGPANDHQREFIFATIWADAEAVKARFGEEWRVSHLPPGYAELIEECTVDHYHLTGRSPP
jgi:quinol monooxygenase YgiN